MIKERPASILPMTDREKLLDNSWYLAYRDLQKEVQSLKKENEKLRSDIDTLDKAAAKNQEMLNNYASLQQQVEEMAYLLDNAWPIWKEDSKLHEDWEKRRDEAIKLIKKS